MEAPQELIDQYNELNRQVQDIQMMIGYGDYDPDELSDLLSEVTETVADMVEINETQSN